ncbi:MAG: GTP-binding protein, partial [Deltaproteobacteria bacterium]|nr:GTP-binding protein [Deltaproteobacteria bacterium]
MPQTRSSLHVNKIAIVGNPNVGKSVLFNQLTQDYSLVANAPYTTVAVHRADVVFNQNRYQVIDTPGIASLDIQSEDGLVTRSILVDEHPELIVFCLDANNLMRSLLLLSQVAELGVPLVCCLNFLDESRLKGIEVNITTCEKLLGVPVVETVASEGRGIRELRRALDHAAVPCLEQLQYSHIVEDALDELSSCFPEAAAPSDAVLLLMLLQDA